MTLTGGLDNDGNKVCDSGVSGADVTSVRRFAIHSFITHSRIRCTPFVTMLSAGLLRAQGVRNLSGSHLRRLQFPQASISHSSQ